MELPLAAALVARLEDPGPVPSTNTELLRLAAAAPAEWPAPSVLVTDRQTAGRGRLGRAWTARPGDALAISMLLRPAVPPSRLPWISLAAGVAMTEALGGLGVAARAKWPNDVLIHGRKVCGILVDGLPDGSGVVVGAGLNHAMSEEALPVPTATSLAVEGGPTDPDVLVAAFLRRLIALAAAFDGAGGDPTALRMSALAVSATVGRRVRLHLPGGASVVGEAVDIDLEGRIVLDAGPIRGTLACASGDVEHLRYE